LVGVASDRLRVQAMGKLLLSFDFEDWHQLVHRRLGLPGWDARGPALERQTAAILALLDELGVRATFFLLGMTAERYPDLVRKLAARGHDLACHGYEHGRVFEQTPDEFRRDVERSTELIESLAGRRPQGYRAPAFSINRDTTWAYEVLCDLGFRYDSSQYDSPRVPNRIQPVPAGPYRLTLPSGREIWELPPTVWRIGGLTIPVGGGAYWRVLPAALLRRALRKVSAADPYAVLYFHPYECDPVPLRAALPEAPTVRQRLAAAAKGLQRNPGRGRVPERIRSIAREFPLVSYEEAYGEIVERNRARPRSLSREGVLV
jgi:polysaccharide deacetylase family protein (PEP-CTERM system associated)